MYRIGEFARIGQVSVKTLRFYDEIGLLRPAWTDPQTGYRYYLAAQVVDLNRILALKDLGLALDEVVRVSQGGFPADRLRELLVSKRAEAERQMEDARTRVDRIDAVLSRIDRDESPSRYAVATKFVGSRLVVSLREEIAGFDDLGGLFAEVESHTRRHRARSTRGALFHGCVGTKLDCEALAFVGGAVPETDRLRVYELPAVEVASVVYAGPLEGAGEAYEALDAWVRASEHQLAGTCLELYLGGTTFGTESVVEIQFPLRDPAATDDVH